MDLIVRHEFNDWPHFYVSCFFNSLHENLKEKYPNHTFTIVNEEERERQGYGSIYSAMNYSVVNPENDKYILVSFFDNWKYHFMKHLGWKPDKMVKFFYPGGFNYLDYFHWRSVNKNDQDVYCPLNIKDIYRSFYYGPYSPIDIDYQFNKETHDEMIFRGWIWPFRETMLSNLNESSIKVIEKRTNTASETLAYEDYLKELSEYRGALSLPGGTEICNRDIECFGVGTPVFRPHINTEYQEPLIPNYHYISCFRDVKYWTGYPDGIALDKFADELVDTWSRVRDDLDYLEFVSKNARSWYERNCTITNNLKYLTSLIDLEELNG